MKFPGWQFRAAFASRYSELFRALDTKDPWTVLHWLETPLESLDGRTPRMAIEQGDLPRALSMAKIRHVIGAAKSNSFASISAPRKGRGAVARLAPQVDAALAGASATRPPVRTGSLCFKPSCGRGTIAP